jgi:hypothetical protein
MAENHRNIAERKMANSSKPIHGFPGQAVEAEDTIKR